MSVVQDYIDDLVGRHKYRPLSKDDSLAAQAFYNGHLNGFEAQRDTLRNGVAFCTKYERVVVGDYGAYVEVAPEYLTATLEVAKGEEWRLNKDYIERRNLSVKYEWYVWDGAKVYFQLDTVKYADYRKGYYYISVLDFDAPIEEPPYTEAKEVWRDIIYSDNNPFTHTDTTAAEIFYQEQADVSMDKINIAVLGDKQVAHPGPTMRMLSQFLRAFKRKAFIRLLVSDEAGLPSLVRRYAKRNNIDIDVYEIDGFAPDWVKYSVLREGRDRRMLHVAHCAIFMTTSTKKSCNFMYKPARDSGRLVVRKLLKGD